MICTIVTIIRDSNPIRGVKKRKRLNVTHAISPLESRLIILNAINVLKISIAHALEANQEIIFSTTNGYALAVTTTMHQEPQEINQNILYPQGSLILSMMSGNILRVHIRNSTEA